MDNKKLDNWMMTITICLILFALWALPVFVYYYGEWFCYWQPNIHSCKSNSTLNN